MSAFISIVLKLTMKFVSILKDLTIVCAQMDTQEIHLVQTYVKVNNYFNYFDGSRFLMFFAATKICIVYVQARRA